MGRESMRFFFRGSLTPPLDLRIQTNHLSHFLMTARLWPLLKATAEKYGDVSLTQAVFWGQKK